MGVDSGSEVGFVVEDRVVDRGVRDEDMVDGSEIKKCR